MHAWLRPNICHDSQDYDCQERLSLSQDTDEVPLCQCRRRGRYIGHQSSRYLSVVDQYDWRGWLPWHNTNHISHSRSQELPYKQFTFFKDEVTRVLLSMSWCLKQVMQIRSCRVPQFFKLSMFVVKSFIIPINGQGYGSICSGHPQCPYSETYRPVPGQFEQGWTVWTTSESNEQCCRWQCSVPGCQYTRSLLTATYPPVALMEVCDKNSLIKRCD